MENVENIRCHTYGCDYFKSKGKNLRFVWPYIIAVIGVFLLLFMIGSALGCEACFECAEACDMDELAECGRDCDEQTDDCFTCEGVTCGDREGCFACEGKWDCSECGGTVYYNLTIVLDENNQSTRKLEKEDLADLDYLAPEYLYGKGETYYKFLGYYDKNGKQYFGEDGERLRSVTGNMTLYAEYEERNVGEEYELLFSTVKPDEFGGGLWFNTPDSTTVIVGDSVSGMPYVPDVPGFTFKGWYNLNDKQVVSPSNMDDWIFHLYTVEYSPEEENREIVLYAKYEENRYTVTFQYANGQTDTYEAKYGEILQDILDDYDRSENSYNYKFFGWKKDSKPLNVDDVTNMTTPIEIVSDMTLYENSKDWVTLYFYSDKDGTQAITYEKKFYEGQECRFSGLMYRDSVEGEYSGSTQTLNDYILTNDELHKGYNFEELWSTSNHAASQGMDSAKVSASKNTFYAKLSIATYTIQYKMDTAGGTEWEDMNIYIDADDFKKSYQYGDADIKLWDEYTLWLDDGVYFQNWYYLDKYGNQVDIYGTTLPTDVYGDLVLYARTYFG